MAEPQLVRLVCPRCGLHVIRPEAASRRCPHCTQAAKNTKDKQ